MLNLGGSVLGFSSANSSSASKGESVSDTIRVISCYADICAMRHPKEGATMVAALWGIFIWKEFKGASKSINMLLVFMLILFLSGLGLIIISGGN